MGLDLRVGCEFFGRFNEEAANAEVEDFSPQKNDGTASSNTSVLHTADAMQGGGAFDFDNTDIIDLDSSIALRSFWTINFFGKWVDDSGRPNFVCGDGGANGFIKIVDVAGDSIVYFNNSAGAEINWTCPTIHNAWSMFTFLSVSDGTSLQLWIDNVLQSAQAINTDIDIDVICEGGGGSPKYEGLLDIFGIWNRQLLPVEYGYLWNDGDGLEFPLTFAEKLCISDVTVKPKLSLTVEMQECTNA